MRAALLALLVLLSTVAGVPLAGTVGATSENATAELVPRPGPVGGPASTEDAAVLQTEDAPPDPPTDVIGWENGVWYNESIPVKQITLGDRGLTERETELLLARTMARVEKLRQLEFTEDVTVEFISRDTLRERLTTTDFGETTNDQVYEAMFVFGEDEDAAARIEGFLGDAVIGYAAEEGSTELTIVTKSEDLHAVSERVLAHELVHVLQDQQFDLSQPRYHRSTLDGEWGKDGLIEGEASYIDHRYSQECISNWTCTRPPSDWSGGSVSAEARTYSLLTSQPYQDGATFVYERYRDGGWEAVNSAHLTPPESSEQIIHRDRSRRVVPLSAEDHSTPGWEVTHENTIGEAGLFVMFYSQRARVEAGQDVLGRDPFDRQHRWDTLDFDFDATEGWGNDVFRAYENGDRRGYTWTLVWDSEYDAKQFEGAYVQALTGLGAWRYGNNTYRMERGPFEDAFYVVRENRTVRIVNAPTVRELEAVDARVDPQPNPYVSDLEARIEAKNETIDSLRDRLAAQDRTIEDRQETTDNTETTSVETPLLPVAVLIAIVIVALASLWRTERR